MFILKKIGCRIFQLGFRAALPLLPYREPKVLSACSELCDVLSKEKTNSVLVITDEGIVKNGITTPLEEALQTAKVKYTVFDKTQPNPTVKNVEDALKLYVDNKCDALVAIGGGSAMDCAKAVITDSDTHHKYAMMSFPLIPHYAVLDAALTYTLPPHMTSTTGMDALTHAVEAYIGRSTTAQTRRLALEATKLVFENVEKAYADGHDHHAREDMLIAAYKAGVAFSKSYVGYIHAVAHSLGGRYGTPHGLANAVIMPYVLEEYGSCVYKKLHHLGVAAGVCAETDTPENGAKRFIAAIRALNTRMNIPDKISGIKEDDIPELARHAQKEANPLYPVPKLMTAKELERFYYKIADWSDNE